MRRATDLFDQQQRKQVAQAVVEAEANTSCEIVPVVATVSGRYDRPEDIIGLWLAVIAAVSTVRDINVLVTVRARFDSATALPRKREHLAAFFAIKGNVVDRRSCLLFWRYRRVRLVTVLTSTLISLL
jgi:uncharacterized membrane protein